MATCKNCGNTYYSKECPHCKRIAWEQTLNKNNKSTYKQEKRINTKTKKSLDEKEKLFKTIRYAIIFFIGLLITGMILDIAVSSYMLKKAEPSINNLNEMTTDMMKANKKLLEDLNKGFKTPNFNK